MLKLSKHPGIAYAYYMLMKWIFCYLVYAYMFTVYAYMLIYAYSIC